MGMKLASTKVTKIIPQGNEAAWCHAKRWKLISSYKSLFTGISLEWQSTGAYYPITTINKFTAAIHSIIVLYLQIFSCKKLYPFQNLSLGFILKIFLKFCKFQPWYSYKIYSYRKRECIRVLFNLFRHVMNYSNLWKQNELNLIA